jgi:catechol 2,3-dioxygenase-like lactoylglutathione lyase family enzyme
VTDSAGPMDWTLEVVILPVSDLERAIAFYRDQVGFDLDHHTTNEFMDVAQLTPRGSGCSIVVGNLPSQNEMAPGSMRGLQLCVADARAATPGRSSSSRREARHRSSPTRPAADSGSDSTHTPVCVRNTHEARDPRESRASCVQRFFSMGAPRAGSRSRGRPGCPSRW